MKKIIAPAVLALLLLVGCSEPKPPADADGDRVEVDNEADTDGDYTFERVTINGMDCIILKNRTYYGYKVITFDCDWDSKEEN